RAFGGLAEHTDWANVHAVREQVWNRVFPAMVRNRRGVLEDSFWYIARHTHLHPGQLIWLCNRIAQVARDEGTFPPEISPRAIVKGVRSLESEIAHSIMAPYAAIYPKINEVMVAAFRQAPARMRVADALKLYRKAAQVWPREYFPLDDWTLVTMAAEVGVIGKVVRHTAQYHIAQFRYHMDSELTFEKEEMCAVHPAFYRLFETPSDAADLRTVCPVVIAEEDDD
ncbi:MAG TPA: hypothetical protein VFX98_08485, partial [Longimicrobiaceae bacterium]|nr:hypothetical protein [Longimicrobiaceae bacterium]